MQSANRTAVLQPPETNCQAATLRVRVVTPDALTHDEIGQWTQWHCRGPRWASPAVNIRTKTITINAEQQADGNSRDAVADGGLDSPYFHPGFTQAVAGIRDDVQVAVLEDEAGTAGFFPFQTGRMGFGQPVGGRLSDFHGAITRPGWHFSPQHLLDGCGLSAWDFSHLPTAQTAFAGHINNRGTSPYIDLTDGYVSYVQAQRKAGSSTIRQTLRKRRKLEREVGPLRFHAHKPDEHLLKTLFEWKSRQYRATGMADVFSFSWTRALLRELMFIREPDFGGQLSVLYAGDELLALHFGMYSRHVLHYWFPVYDPAFGKYSPGLILLLEMARDAAEAGRQRFDLGKGDEDYKHSLGPKGIDVGSGAVENGLILRNVRRCWRNTRTWLKTSTVGAPVRATARLARPLRDWLSFR